ncbi:hypothetical protein FZC84_07135 [Rossellomorea vietnamensis]|uniref:DinB-like domain-containing protein n=1 Tax=Rossellomorea vietnamensis TaxID=218284 RepID=A0A5D4MFS4_9BACI|nr:hypothetical protein [Rossellomorea vietnamensis]TYS00309.1 hypothetical protein FZC84_07135 [Rossellomorea vietnamensis]
MKEKIIKEKSRIAEWALSLKDVPEDLWFMSFKEGSWGTGEVIAHLMFWDHFVMDSRLKPFLNNEGLPDLTIDVQKINDTAAAYARSSDKQELIVEFVSARNELAGLLYSMPIEMFSQAISGKGITWSHYLLGLIEHDKNHQNQIDNFF